MDADEPVLIALVRHPRDLEIVRSEHWYRIPVKHAPRLFSQAAYLAFYLTSRFGDNRWSVKEYAPVRGHEMVRRRDLLPEEDGHPRADEPYYKIELGPNISLPRPIRARVGRRITFIWTNGDKFSNACELNDLLGKGPADDLLWQALKGSGISAERQITVRDGKSRYRVDYWIPCALGALVLVIGPRRGKLPKGKKWRSLYLSEEEIYSRPTTCIRQIRHLVRELGNTKQTLEHCT